MSEGDVPQPNKPIPSHFHDGMEIFACPCGSREIGYRPHDHVFCMSCSKRGPDATTKEGAIEAWNRYVTRAYWRHVYVLRRIQAKPSA